MYDWERRFMDVGLCGFLTDPERRELLHVPNLRKLFPKLQSYRDIFGDVHSTGVVDVAYSRRILPSTLDRNKRASKARKRHERRSHAGFVEAGFHPNRSSRPQSKHAKSKSTRTHLGSQLKLVETTSERWKCSNCGFVNKPIIVDSMWRN